MTSLDINPFDTSSNAIHVRLNDGPTTSDSVATTAIEFATTIFVDEFEKIIPANTGTDLTECQVRECIAGLSGLRDRISMVGREIDVLADHMAGSAAFTPMIGSLEDIILELECALYGN